MTPREGVGSLRTDLDERLARLDQDDLRRELKRPTGIDFCSNDYLGLASSGAIRELVEKDLGCGAISAPASRLLRGNLPEHEELETRLARFKGTESALLFSTGYQANLGVLTSLLRKNDRVLSDELNHASIIDGVRLSGATKVIYPHLDIGAVAGELSRAWPGGRTFVVTESYFSMDGDVAPIRELADIADDHGAALIVDDAHAIGVYGDERGSGLVEAAGIADRCAAITSTFGKALGGFGAFVAASRTVIDWLVNSARPFIFTTALPPLLLRLVEAGLDLCETGRERRLRLHALSDRLRESLRRAGLDCLRSVGPIVPVIIGDNRAAISTAEALAERGFDVRAIRPPSVAAGTARLRISVHADHSEDLIDRLASAVIERVTPLGTPR